MSVGKRLKMHVLLKNFNQNAGGLLKPQAQPVIKQEHLTSCITLAVIKRNTTAHIQI